MTRFGKITAILLLCCPGAVVAEVRQSTSLDAYWRFAREDNADARHARFDDSKWHEVTLPHTFNGGDGEDGGTYYRGAGWYRRTVVLDEAIGARRAWLQFDGAALSTDVYVNGAHAGKHDGGYARFRMDVSPHLQVGTNVIAVRVDNARQPHIAPLGGDFTVFGGLYRHVSLVLTADIHVDMLDFGGPGVYVNAESLSDDAAEIAIRAHLRNARARSARVAVTSRILDAEGKEVARANTSVSLDGNQTRVAALKVKIPAPRRWNGVFDPYLYRVVTELRDRSAATPLDSVTVPLGLRAVAIDASRGFLLNGKPYPLHGVNLFHSGRPARGLAVTDDEIRADMATLKELGVTGVRFVHFQHPPLAYEEADRLGFVVWTEIPLNGAIDPGLAFEQNLEQQARELIRQNYNHPSVGVWGLGNEVYAVNPDVNRVLAHAQQVMNREDPTRPTTYAHCCQADDDPKASHSDTISFNRYFGWYPEQKGSLGEWAKSFHARFPQRAVSIGEYGAGASIRHQEATPSPPDTAGGWHPEQYQTQFHEKTWPEISGLDFLWGKFIWVAFDLASDGRAEGDRPGINDKGIVTYDRAVRKDAFYYYQAQWSADPMVHIADKRASLGQSSTTDIKAYTNATTATLEVNGSTIGAAPVVGGIARWRDVRLQEADKVEVVIDAAGTKLRDTATWYRN